MHPHRRAIRRRRRIAMMSMLVLFGLGGWYRSDGYLQTPFDRASRGCGSSPIIWIVRDNETTYVFSPSIDIPDEIEAGPGQSGRLRSDVDYACIYMFLVDYSSSKDFFKPDIEWSQTTAWHDQRIGDEPLLTRTPHELMKPNPSPPLNEFEAEVRDGMAAVMTHRWWGWPSLQSVQQSRVYTFHWGGLLTNLLLVLSLPTFLYCVMRNAHQRFLLFKRGDDSCAKCGYSLEGLPFNLAPICPECGCAIPQEQQLNSPIRSAA